MGEVEGALEVDVDDGIPLLFGHAEHESVLGDACVVDEDVDGSEVFLYFLYDFFCGVEVGGVACIGAAGDAHGFYLPACGLESGCHVVVKDEVCECYVCAFGGELQGDGFANAPGCTRDECGFSFK